MQRLIGLWQLVPVCWTCHAATSKSTEPTASVWLPNKNIVGSLYLADTNHICTIPKSECDNDTATNLLCNTGRFAFLL
eukprot:1155892-Amphidinium_carterae.1